MPRGHGRRARVVTQEIRVKRMGLSDGRGSTLAVSCVFAREMAAREMAAPAGRSI
jgi:hypothetical protein